MLRWCTAGTTHLGEDPFTALTQSSCTWLETGLGSPTAGMYSIVRVVSCSQAVLHSWIALLRKECGHKVDCGELPTMPGASAYQCRAKTVYNKQTHRRKFLGDEQALQRSPEELSADEEVKWPRLLCTGLASLMFRNIGK